MALSQKTLDEMRAGAEQLARHAGVNGIDPDYMAAMIRTQQRAAWLAGLQRAGKSRIVKNLRKNTNLKDCLDFQVTTVYVGDETFEDYNGELVGAWPSEVLVARVALALGAQGEI